MAVVEIECPHCGSKQKVSTRRVATEAMCLKCGQLIKDPYLYKAAPEEMQLDVRLKGRIVTDFGTTKLEDLKSRSDEYTGKFEPVDDDASGEYESREETTVRFDSGMYTMPKNETRRISTAAKTYTIGLSLLAVVTVVVVAIGFQMLYGDGQDRHEELDTAGGGNTRLERYPSGAVKVQWTIADTGDDVPHGTWTEFYRTGEKSLEGRYHMGERVGTWTGWHDNGRKSLEGAYESDEPVGIWTEWHPTGHKLSQGEYVDGEKHGEWRTWHRGGQLDSVQRYENGRPVGEFIALWPDGTRRMVGRWENGRRVGRWVSYHDNRVIEKVEHWQDGILHGETYGNHRNRHQCLRGEWNEGLRHGEWTWWHYTGEPEKQGRFEDGIEVGEWKEWHVTGDLKLEGSYDNGVKHGRWLQYDEQGKLAARRVYEAGKLTDEQHYFRGNEVDRHIVRHGDGTVREEWTSLKDDEGKQIRHGWYRSYYVGGQLGEIGLYLHGRKHGDWRTFDHDGTLLQATRYDHGTESR